MANVTISRQFGAGGHTLGLQVSSRLKYQLVERDILHQIAKEANVSERWVEAVEREAGGLLMRLVNNLVSSDFIERLTQNSSSDFDQDKYYKFLTKAIKELADDGEVVFVGRGTQFILADDPETIKVLLTADKKHRLEFLMECYDLTLEKAEDWIQKEERRRINFLRHFYDGDPDAPHLYDLVLNMSHMTLDEAEEQIVEAVKRNIDQYARPIW